MLRRAALWAAAALLGAAALGWALSAPDRLPDGAMAGLSGDPERGRAVFHAGGCAACHAAPGAEGEARLVQAGGRRFATPFGAFVAPNISPHPEHGVGGWTLDDFADAMMRGVAPDGGHYYPVFPYLSYARMNRADIADLWAFVAALPVSDRPNEAHEVGFPFNIRRGLGLWKRLYLSDAPVVAVPAEAEAERGRYLVEGPGHCAECHTPRDAIGGPVLDRWMAGAPSPDGRGRIPNITPGGGDISSWSAADIAEYLKSGFTPDYDTAGGEMVEVIANTSQLGPEDRAAMAAYLKALPPLPDG